MSSIRSIEATELPAASRLLRAADLPTSDITAASAISFWAKDHGGELAGIVGLEHVGKCVLLRSLVVHPSQRDRGLGRELVAHAEQEARREGFLELSLLTTSAEGFFRAMGYRIVERGDVTPDIRQAAQFRSLCPASAVCMSKSL